MERTETDRINTKEYWNFRFNSGNWNRNGNIQTKEYAKANIEMTGLSASFNGAILNFGNWILDII